MSLFYHKLTTQPSFIAGPCLFESLELACVVASDLFTHAEAWNYNYCFKASWDKANRSSGKSSRSYLPLEKVSNAFKQVKDFVNGIEVTTDIHEPHQVDYMESVDIIQIPALLCRQTDLLKAAAESGKTVSVKKGQFMSPYDMENTVNKLIQFGCDEIILIERGTTFGYNNLVVDFRSIPIMKTFGYPVVFDASHSCQLPGVRGSSSGGEREFIAPLTKAANAIGADGIFLEVHTNPPSAQSDRETQLTPMEYKILVEECLNK